MVNEETGEKMSVCPVHHECDSKGQERKGDWIQTYMGVQFFPQDPRIEDVRLLDIAHALSHLCRFTGHVETFYSVAEHSVRVSLAVPEEHAKWALLHDASEAYLADMSRPVKNFSSLGSEYRRLEADLMRVICDRFDLAHDMPLAVREADDVLLMTEKRDLLGGHVHLPKWRETSQPLVSKILLWSCGYAKHQFLARAFALEIK